MKLKIVSSVAAALAVFGVGSAAHGSACDVQCGFLYSGGTYTILSAPGSFSTTAISVNDKGQIIGTFNNSNGTFSYLYSGGVYTTLSVPTPPIGIDNQGQIVGTNYLYSGGTYTSLSVPGSFSTTANAVNENGQIIGTYTDNSGTKYFQYTAGVYSTISLPGLPGPVSGFNDNGQIAGTYTGKFGSLSGTLGFLYSGGTYTTIAYADSGYCFPGGCPSITIPKGLNDNGLVVGLYWAGNNFYGFPIGGPPVSNLCCVSDDGINNLGQIVGVYGVTPEPATLALFAIGLGALGLLGWRRKMKAQAVVALH